MFFTQTNKNFVLQFGSSSLHIGALLEKGFLRHKRDVETDITSRNLEEILSIVAGDSKNITFFFDC